MFIRRLNLGLCALALLAACEGSGRTALLDASASDMNAVQLDAAIDAMPTSEQDAAPVDGGTLDMDIVDASFADATDDAASMDGSVDATSVDGDVQDATPDAEPDMAAVTGLAHFDVLSAVSFFSVAIEDAAGGDAYATLDYGGSHSFDMTVTEGTQLAVLSSSTDSLLATSEGATIRAGGHYRVVAYADPSVATGTRLRVFDADEHLATTTFAWTYFNAASALSDARARLMPSESASLLPIATAFDEEQTRQYAPGTYRAEMDFDGDNVPEILAGGYGDAPFIANTTYLSVVTSHSVGNDWFVFGPTGVTRVVSNPTRVRAVSLADDAHAPLPISLHGKQISDTSWTRYEAFTSMMYASSVAASPYVTQSAGSYVFRWFNTTDDTGSALANTGGAFNVGYDYSVILLDREESSSPVLAATFFTDNRYFIPASRARVAIASVVADYGSPRAVRVNGSTLSRWCDGPISSTPCVPSGDLELGTYALLIDLDNDTMRGGGEPLFMFEVTPSMIGKSTLMLVHGYEPSYRTIPKLYVVYEDVSTIQVISSEF